MVQQVLQILGFIFEGIGLAGGVTIASIVMKKDSRYVGNQLMAASMILLGIYMGSILTYDILFPIFQSQEWIVQVFYRIALVALFFGTMFLFFTIQVMCQSSAWLTKRNTIPYAVIIAAFSITICFIDFLTIVSGDQVNTRVTNMIPLYILIAGVVYFITFSMIGLYRYGISKSDGIRKKKMTLFFTGLAISMGSIIINVLSNILADPLGVLDVLFFGTLAIAMIVMTFGFVGRQSDSKQELQIDMHD